MGSSTCLVSCPLRDSPPRKPEVLLGVRRASEEALGVRELASPCSCLFLSGAPSWTVNASAALGGGVALG